jgi:hypothetical protein
MVVDNICLRCGACVIHATPQCADGWGSLVMFGLGEGNALHMAFLVCPKSTLCKSRLRKLHGTKEAKQSR